MKLTKKTRRARSKGSRAPVRLSPSQLVRPIAAEPSAAPRPVAPAEPQPADLRDEYRYVVADLKRIGVIAAVMLAVLVVLAFVLV